MGHWNYRVLREKVGESDKEATYRYEICECFYDENGKIWAWSDGHTVSGDSLDEMESQIDHMVQALTSPVLDKKNLPEEGAINPCPTDEQLADEKWREENLISMDDMMRDLGHDPDDYKEPELETEEGRTT